MFYLLLFIIVVVGVIFLKSYNRLQLKGQKIKEALSNISVSLQKKVNLVNQLIDIVKNYQDGEQLIHLTISKDTTQSAIMTSHSEAQTALIGLQGMAQKFPELKANEQYGYLMRSIHEIENNVSQQRERYNQTVNDYNSSRVVIPTVFVANLLKFPEAPYLDFTQENTEQTILKDFNLDSGEHLNTLLSSAKNNIVEGSKSLANKAADTGKKIIEHEKFQEVSQKITGKTDMDKSQNTDGSSCIEEEPSSENK